MSSSPVRAEATGSSLSLTVRCRSHRSIFLKSSIVKNILVYLMPLKGVYSINYKVSTVTLGLSASSKVVCVVDPSTTYTVPSPPARYAK